MPRRPIRSRAWWTGVALAAVLALSGCQMQVAVDVEVADDGSGLVRVGVGLDDDALGHAGDLATQVHSDDLAAAGWTVTPASRNESGWTWLWASKPFATPEQAGQVIGELAGPDGAFRDFTVQRDNSLLGTTYSVDGMVDLTGGPATFSDAALAATLGGDPFGGTLTAIEQEEGRPVSEMVDFTVSVSLPGMDEPQQVAAHFDDPAPTAVAVSSTQRSALASLGVWALVALAALAALVALRSAFRRHSRGRSEGLA